MSVSKISKIPDSITDDQGSEIPDWERRLIENLYWRQHAAVWWDWEISRDVKVERRVRQHCALLCGLRTFVFNLCSEFVIKETM